VAEAEDRIDIAAGERHELVLGIEVVVVDLVEEDLAAPVLEGLAAVVSVTRRSVQRSPTARPVRVKGPVPIGSFEKGGTKDGWRMAAG
jgi:hypothetical protein